MSEIEKKIRDIINDTLMDDMYKDAYEIIKDEKGMETPQVNLPEELQDKLVFVIDADREAAGWLIIILACASKQFSPFKVYLKIGV